MPIVVKPLPLSSSSTSVASPVTVPALITQIRALPAAEDEVLAGALVVLGTLDWAACNWASGLSPDVAA